MRRNLSVTAALQHKHHAKKQEKQGKKASERLSGEKSGFFSNCVQLCRDSSGKSNGKKHPWHLGVYVIWFPARRCWAEQNYLRRATSFSSLWRAGQDSSASVVTCTLHMFRTATDEYLHCQFILQSIQSIAWLFSLNVSETKMTSYTVSAQTHSVYSNSRKIFTVMKLNMDICLLLKIISSMKAVGH